MEFDQNLYSRQVGAFGVEAMGKLIKLRVFLYGLRGLGIETAKNLILAGPNTVVLQDDEKVQVTDLASNFYVKESDIGHKSRAEASVGQLKELNPYVKVEVRTGAVTKEALKGFDVVVFTDYHNADHLLEFNEFCRTQEKPIGFIYSGILGLYGFTFVDYGTAHTIFDKDGEENKSSIITFITKSNPGVVNVHADKRHGFVDGDHVTFREVQGMTEINGKTMKIKVNSPFEFTIDDTSSFHDYDREGLVEQVKVPFTTHFHSLKHTLTQPYTKGKGEGLDNPDLVKFGRPELLHLTLNAILEFGRHHGGELPGFLDQGHAEQVVKIAKEIAAKLKEEEKTNKDVYSVDELDEKVIANVAKYARAQLSPHASFFGGIVAQEIVKITGKFTPLRQWLHHDTLDLLVENNPIQSASALKGTRYDHQLALFGPDCQERLAKQKTFLVGAGALGCEFIKMFALMGLAAGGKTGQGKLTVTDDDNIEISNLNRQFLFRKENVGHSKASCACAVGRKLNHDLNVQDLKMRVCADTEQTFDDNFWEGLSFVVNAVDNVQARLFVDSRCVFYGKYLFESGTLGTKCNSQIVVPFKTQSYGESQDPQEESIPLCTLKNFPYQIEHCIQWARDYFEGSFADGPSETNKYLENPAGHLAALRKSLKDQQSLLRGRLDVVKKLVHQYERASLETCIELAVQMFQDIFFQQISQLLHSFPIDYKNENGTPFWSGPKRPPVAINYDANDDSHLDFVVAAANIYAFIFKLPYCNDRALLKQVSSKVPLAPFAPKNVKINTDPNSRQDNATTEDDEPFINALTEELGKRTTATPSEKLMNAVEFEKDDDSNFHIDFITAVSNLRARNYKITEVPRLKVKLIAGKIIPAIATTTAMVVGAVGFEILRFVLEKDFSTYRNSFMNLALPLWLFSEPLPPTEAKDKDYDPIMMGPVKAIPPKWTNWHRLEVKGPLDINGIIKHFKDVYNIELSMISATKYVVYNKYDPKYDKKKLEMTPDAILQVQTGKEWPNYKRYLEMEVSGEQDGVECLLPTVKYRVKP